MSRSKRSLPELDYQVLHRTGKKIEKSSDTEIESLSSSFESLKTCRMDHLNHVKGKEKKLVVQFKNMKEPSELFSLSEILEYIGELKEIKKNYLEIHVDLEDELGSDEYKKSYKHYEKIIGDLKKSEFEVNRKMKKEEERIKQEEKEEREA